MSASLQSICFVAAAVFGAAACSSEDVSSERAQAVAPIDAMVATDSADAADGDRAAPQPFADCVCGAQDCSPVQFDRIDPVRACVLERMTFGCSGVGPPAMGCSIDADGVMYRSPDGRTFPGARRCTDGEEGSPAFNAFTPCAS